MIIYDMKLQVNYVKDVTAENRKLINWVSLGVCFKKFMFCLHYCRIVSFQELKNL